MNACLLGPRLTACVLPACVAAVALLASDDAAHAQGVRGGLFAGLSNLDNYANAQLDAFQDEAGFVGVLEENQVDGPSVLPVTLNSNYTFGTEEDNGVFAISGNASAQSVAGILRASARTTVTDNTVSDFGTPFLVGDGDDPAGIPTTAGFSAYAGFTDRLQYGGTATNYGSRFLFRLTGRIENPGAFVVVTIQHAAQPAQSFFFTEVGDFNEVVATEAYVHGGGFQDLSVDIQVSADADPMFDFGGDTLTADFSNTLEIIGFELRDADTNQLLTNEIVTTFAGGTLPITAIPEPTSIALLALGGLAFATRRGRHYCG